MKSEKRATISGLTETIIIVIVVLLAWVIIDGRLNKVSASIIDTLKEKIGLTTKQEKDIKQREEEAKKEIMEAEKKKVQGARTFFNNLINGYEQCISGTTHPVDKVSGINWACNCKLELNLESFRDFKLSFQYYNDNKDGALKTKIRLLDYDNIDVAPQKELQQKFIPYVMSSVSRVLPYIARQTIEIKQNDLEAHQIKGKLLLAKSKYQSGQEIVFFGDEYLEDCPLK